uniref:SAP domain-containing protein n=1 Tax=Heterorhabditis bacteriophora TaxID=37862 RepID=A0A1I7X1D1_HETBA
MYLLSSSYFGLHCLNICIICWFYFVKVPYKIIINFTYFFIKYAFIIYTLLIYPLVSGMSEDDPLVNGQPLSALRVVDLKEELDKRGLSKLGNKGVLAERLREYIFENESPGGVSNTSPSKEKNSSPTKIVGCFYYYKILVYISKNIVLLGVKIYLHYIIRPFNILVSAEDTIITVDENGQDHEELDYGEEEEKETKDEVLEIDDRDTESVRGRDLKRRVEAPESLLDLLCTCIYIYIYIYMLMTVCFAINQYFNYFRNIMIILVSLCSV